MEQYNNVTHNNKPSSLNKSRSNNNFSNAAVHKTDVGDFQEGYFVMADLPTLPQQRPKTHKTPERNQRKKNSRERSTKDSNNDHQQVREGDMHVSTARLPTSPTRSPPRHSKRNFHSPPQQVPQTIQESPLSPHKPRKAHYLHEKPVGISLDTVSGSPPKDKGPSPPPSQRWAGPAFSNAPPPSSLPMPEFPPFQVSSSVLSSSPPSSSGPTTFFASYSEPQLYVPQPFFAASAYQPAYSVQFSYADPYQHVQNEHAQQLSTDLRRMLNISHPIKA